MTEPEHDGEPNEPAMPAGPPGVPEPLPPGCFGLVFAGLTAIGLAIAFYFWMDSFHGNGRFLSSFGAGIGAAAVAGLGLIVVPIVSLVMFFFGRGYGQRRRMNILIERFGDIDEPPAKD